MELFLIISLIISLLTLSIGFVVYFRNRKNLINQFFFFFTFSVFAWIVGVIALNFIYQLPKEKALIIGRLPFLAATLLCTSLFYFVQIFPRKIILIPKAINSLVFLLSVFIIGSTLFTNLILRDIVFEDATPTAEFGLLIPLFGLFFIILSIFSLGILAWKYKKSREIERIQLFYLLLGLGISIFFGTLTNLIIPQIDPFIHSYRYGPSGVIFFAIFTALAITRYHLFEIRVILTEVLVGVIGLLLLVQAMTAESFAWQILGLGLFVLFCVFGYLLIKSVILEIKRRQEIEKIDKAKSEFISIASHQLRTPLTAVKGYISMILEGTYGQLAEKQARPLENVYQSNERLIRLVNDLLNLSRLDAGKIEFSPELTSLEEMVSGIVEELRINAEKKGLYMKMIKPLESLPKIMVDQDKLRQVILNIVDNAIKYTRKGGITLELKKLNEEEEIRVLDTGEGMDEKELNSLFQVFSRATAGTQLHAEGAGIGLYVARQFVEMHGGKIWAESPGKGKGATFIIQLPIKLDPKLLKEKTKTITKAANDIF